jgi:hypothetical protein
MAPWLDGSPCKFIWVALANNHPGHDQACRPADCSKRTGETRGRVPGNFRPPRSGFTLDKFCLPVVVRAIAQHCAAAMSEGQDAIATVWEPEYLEIVSESG